jgi:PAS domain-containing protein
MAPATAAADRAAAPDVRLATLDALDRAPDGFVVTSPDGNILYANPAFLDLAQLATDEQARGQ